MRDDQALLLAWREGERHAGSELVGRHFQSIYRFFASKVGDKRDAEDLTQRTFTAAVEGLDRFRGHSSVRTWLFAIAHNVLRKWYRGRCRGRGREFGLGELSVRDLGVGPSTALRANEDQRRLITALQQLPVESQLILELYYWEQLTASELGEVLGCPEGTARGRLRKAKLELRALFDQLARTGAQLDLKLAWRQPPPPAGC